MLLSDEQLQDIAPFPILKAAGDQVSQTWHELRQRPGVAPVLLGNREAAGLVLKEGVRSGGSVAEVLAKALEVDVDAWMAQRIRSNPALYDIASVDVPWDGVERRIGPFIPAHDHRGTPYPEVFFGLVPAEIPWQVPAHMRTRGMAEVPESAVQVALFRRWYERNGAVVTTVADGVVELQVDRPPATMEEARQVAIEHFIYCPDNIHQGIITLGNFTAALCNGRLWYFWWSLDSVRERLAAAGPATP